MWHALAQPRCDEPWVEFIFQNSSEGKLEVSPDGEAFQRTAANIQMSALGLVADSLVVKTTSSLLLWKVCNQHFADIARSGSSLQCTLVSILRIGVERMHFHWVVQEF